MLCEKGIAFESTDMGSWRVLSSKADLIVNDPRRAASEYGVRPVIILKDLNELPTETIVLPTKVDENPFQLQPADIAQNIFNQWNSQLFPAALKMNYVLGGTIYHLKRLAELYSEISQQYSDGVKIHNVGQASDKSEQFWAGNRGAPFYEVEAFITSVRRTYDSMRYVIWHGFGENKDSVPANYLTTIERHNKLPEPIKARLMGSWNRFGLKATAYRDCIQHYVPISNGWSMVRMDRLKGGVWLCSVLLPDNPEARSTTKFTYDLEIDALTYSWDLAHEMLSLVLELTMALPDTRPWLDRIQPD